MKIAIVTGSYPPDTCGVGDYTFRLVNALVGQGLDVDIIRHDSWHIKNLSRILTSVRAVKADLVHIQYPSAGFRKHLTPQLLSLAFPGVVTIHEMTKAHVLRKLSLYPYFLRSRHIIFTTPFERDFALRSAPWIARRSSVIPVGSYILVGRGREKQGNEIVYFGLFRPNKGLEDVLGLAQLIKQRGLPYRVRMIGKAFPPGSSYFQELSERSRDLPVLWNIDLDDTSVADILSAASIAYMPFPDGASGRRTSLLALLANGVATITTRGSHTPSGLENCALFAKDPEQALSEVQRLQDPVFRDRLSENSRSYAGQFSWDFIAGQHKELYERLVAKVRYPSRR